MEGLLGRGGIGEVHRISFHGKPYALKRVQARCASDEAQRRRLLREGRLLERMRPPNVVEVHETGVTQDGIVWIRMEMLDWLRAERRQRRARGLRPAASAATRRFAAETPDDFDVSWNDDATNRALLQSYADRLAAAMAAGVAATPPDAGELTNDGTQAAPVNTLAQAIARAAERGARVYACAETFDEAVDVPAGVTLFGGLDCAAGWVWAGGGPGTAGRPGQGGGGGGGAKAALPYAAVSPAPAPAAAAAALAAAAASPARAAGPAGRASRWPASARP